MGLFDSYLSPEEHKPNQTHPPIKKEPVIQPVPDAFDDGFEGLSAPVTVLLHPSPTPQPTVKKIACPKCGSENVNVSLKKISEASKAIGSGRKAIVSVTGRRRYAAKRTSEVDYASFGLCKNCGHNWQVTESNKSKSDWYTRPWAALLFCVLFFPLGLYWLWHYKHFSKGARIAITLVIAVIAVAGFFS